jgi:hypothetical protein
MPDWWTPFDGSGIDWHESLPSPYTYQEADFCKLVAAVHEYEAALIEARAALTQSALPTPKKDKASGG